MTRPPPRGVKPGLTALMCNPGPTALNQFRTIPGVCPACDTLKQTLRWRSLRGGAYASPTPTGAIADAGITSLVTIVPAFMAREEKRRSSGTSTRGNIRRDALTHVAPGA